jgi:hypothetical protein
MVERSLKRADAKDAKQGATAAQRITRHIAELRDWRGEVLTRLRTVIRAAVAHNLSGGQRRQPRRNA